MGESPKSNEKEIAAHVLYKRSYMSAHILLNLLNELRKRDQM